MSEPFRSAEDAAKALIATDKALRARIAALQDAVNDAEDRANERGSRIAALEEALREVERLSNTGPFGLAAINVLVRQVLDRQNTASDGRPNA